MMSGKPLETCYAFNKFWNNKFYYNGASCWLSLLIHTTMHGSMNIKSILTFLFSSGKDCIWMRSCNIIEFAVGAVRNLGHLWITQGQQAALLRDKSSAWQFWWHQRLKELAASKVSRDPRRMLTEVKGPDTPESINRLCQSARVWKLMQMAQLCP
jgi:hypothetical protein